MTTGPLTSRGERPFGIYVHIPFCANICYYCACNKVITKDRGRAQAYMQRLEHEIQMIACHLDPGQVVEQLHLGGGTPTFLSHDELRHVMAVAAQHGIAVPAHADALAYFDAMRTARGTANMIQGQRDFFGLHGFARLDDGRTDQHGPWAAS